MVTFDVFRDRLDPRESLIPSQRAYLASLSPRARARMLAALLAALGIDADWTPVRRMRLVLLRAAGGDVRAARERCALEFVCWRVCPDQDGTHDGVPTGGRRG